MLCVLKLLGSRARPVVAANMLPGLLTKQAGAVSAGAPCFLPSREQLLGHLAAARARNTHTVVRMLQLLQLLKLPSVLLQLRRMLLRLHVALLLVKVAVVSGCVRSFLLCGSIDSQNRTAAAVGAAAQEQQQEQEQQQQMQQQQQQAQEQQQQQQQQQQHLTTSDSGGLSSEEAPLSARPSPFPQDFDGYTCSEWFNMTFGGKDSAAWDAFWMALESLVQGPTELGDERWQYFKYVPTPVADSAV